MNITPAFLEFVSKTVLPQQSGNYEQYKQYYQTQLDRLLAWYTNAFAGQSLLEIDLTNRSQTLDQLDGVLTSFQQRQPRPSESDFHFAEQLLKTDLPLFIKNYDAPIRFETLQEFIDQVHRSLGTDFCRMFQQKRIEFNGNARVGSKNLLFGEVRDDEWTINIGAERELQYQVFLKKDKRWIGYGLSFNVQRTQNNRTPIEMATPFINAFNKHRTTINRLLRGYSIIIGQESNFHRVEEEQFTCFGQRIPIQPSPANQVEWQMDGLDFLEMIYNLKGRQFEAYQLIFSNPTNTPDMNPQVEQLVDLLKYKKQIILQGPPGTGKTRLAKQIARALISLNPAPAPLSPPSTLTAKLIQQWLTPNTIVPTIAGNATYEIIDVTKDRVKSRKKNLTEDDTLFKNIIEAYNQKAWEISIDNNNDRRAAAFASYIQQQLTTATSSGTSSAGQATLLQPPFFNFIQFHPAYSYEDFVRGIKAESKGESIEFRNVNRILGQLAEDAQKNWEDAHKDTSAVSRERLLEEQLQAFADQLAEQLTETGPIPLTNNVSIYDVEEDAFRYRSPEWRGLGYRMLFKDIVTALCQDAATRKDLIQNAALSGQARKQATYYVKVIERFKAYLDQHHPNWKHPTLQEEPLNNFVLVIDEINRANLSSVLGELIYALEYRGKPVKSVYPVEGVEDLILPKNLFIIGTMNTADRTVGHLDYAVRRRFAFVQVLPQVLTENFDVASFQKVSELFVKDPLAETLEPSEFLSPEFDHRDVWLGHSYFITKNKDIATRWQYEILPILEEYIKDGILRGGPELNQKLRELQTTLV